VKGVWETGEAEGLDVVTEVEFVEGDGFIDLARFASLEWVFKVDAAAGGFGIRREVGFELGEVVFVAGTVGIEADDGEFEPA